MNFDLTMKYDVLILFFKKTNQISKLKTLKIKI